MIQIGKPNIRDTKTLLNISLKFSLEIFEIFHVKIPRVPVKAFYENLIVSNDRLISTSASNWSYVEPSYLSGYSPASALGI